MADRNLDLALRMKADVTQAVDGLKNVRTEIDKTDAAAAGAGKSTQGLGDALDKTSKTTKGLGDALDKAAETETKAATAAESHTSSLNVVGAAMRGATGASDKLGTSLGRTAASLASGNYTAAAKNMASVGTAAAGVEGAIGAVAVGVNIAVVALAAFTFAVIKGEQEDEKFNRALIATGGIAGTTLTQLRDMAGGMSSASISIGQAKDALQQLIATGKFTSDTLGMAARAAVNMSQLTGESLGKAVSAIVALQDDPVRAVQRLDQQLHFLSQTTLEQMLRLQDMGRAQDAAALATNELADVTESRSADMAQNVGTLIRLWRSLTSYIKGAADAALDFGRQHSPLEQTRSQIGVLQQQVASIQKQAAEADQRYESGLAANLRARLIPLQKQIDGLTVLADKQDKAATAAAKSQSQAAADKTAANDALIAIHNRELEADSTKRLANETAKLRDQFAALHKVNPGADLLKGVQFDASGNPTEGGAYDSQLAYLRSRILPKPANGRADTSAQREAEKVARDAARAQDQLTQSLIQMQGQLDPTAQAWATYNAAVKKANDEAALAKKAPGADPAAIDAQRDAVIGLAATIRDAALDKLADQDRQAWQRLKDSLRDPVEVATDKAVAQLQELNRLMVQLKGTKDEISPQEYATAAQSIVQKGIGNAPQQTQVDNDYTGGGRMFAQNFQERAALDKWHEDALKANEEFRQKDLISEQQYQQELVSINAQYNAQRTANDKARGDILLSTTANIFGQLATLSSSHNKKMAAIGKASAIAQAIIDTYQSATAAYKAMAGIPYVGPALGVAAAAAAIAAGLANVAQIRSQNVGGYAEGGYTGPGGKHTPAGIVHAGEVVWSQADIARAGGVGIVETMRLRGYADGGVVAPFANAPSPDQLGFRDLPRPAVRMPSADAGNAGTRAPAVGVRIINAIDPQFVTDGMASSAGEQVILNTIARNRMRVKQTIG